MPEGDTIHRSAQRLAPVLDGATVVAADDNGRFVDSSQLRDVTFASTIARGKHLLMQLSDGRVLHSHMGMTGSWHTYAVGEPWRKPSRWAALQMQVETHRGDAATVVCFSPKTLKLLTATQFRRHAYLNRLGPDLMSPGELVEADVLARFRVHNLATIGEAVMNQTIVCGIGNVYKSETLFLTATNPMTRVSELSDESVFQIVARARELMLKNRQGYPRKTRLSADSHHLWVYGRSGEPCFTCGSEIRLTRQGDLGRSTYWCPVCQAG